MSKEHEIDWGLVADGLRAGRYNLLLGAGASHDSWQPDGQNLPLLSHLQADWSVALPGVKGSSSINRLYRSLKAQDLVEELLTSRVLGCTAGPTNKAITTFRWRRIFTLNVDDALEQAYEANPQRAQDFKVLNFNDEYEEIRDSSVVPIVHLHGFSRRSEDGYIFDIKEYVSSIKSNNIWAHNLAGFIRSEPFFVVGSSIEESDLSYFLSERSHIRPREDKSPSLLIEPFPDDTTCVDCEELKLKLYEGLPAKFFEELAVRVPDRSSVFDVALGNIGDISTERLTTRMMAEFLSDFERVPLAPEAGDHDGTRFAYGHQATWGDLRFEFDQERESYRNLQNISQASGGEALIVLSGEAGSGKTTGLRRVAFNLAQVGRPCFWHRAIGRIRIDALKAVAEASNEPIFLFIDNAADSVVELLDIRRSIPREKIVIVCAERNYRINHINRVFGPSDVIEIKIPPVGLNVSERLVEAYAALGLVGAKVGGDYSHSISEDHIAIACCRILNDFQPLDKIIDRSINDASVKHRECYGFVSLASHCYRGGIAYDLISRVFPNYLVDRMSEDEDASLPIDIIERSGVDFVIPLNEAFSDSILRRLKEFHLELLLKLFCDLADAIQPKVSVSAVVRGEPAARLASRLFDYDEVVKPLLGAIPAERFFAHTKRGWEWNSRYWHQIALFKMDQAMAAVSTAEAEQLSELAVQHARFSKTIEPNHQFTYTMIGRMIFRRLTVLGKIKPSEISEAISSLRMAIQIEDSKSRSTMHPFMILFQGLNDALLSGALLSPAERTTVAELIRQSFQKFPKEGNLRASALALQGLM